MRWAKNHQMRGVQVSVTRTLAFWLVVLLGIPVWVSAQEEPIGRVDWAKGYVSGFGIGLAEPGSNRGLARTSSIRAAKVDALRNLLKTIHQLHIDPRIRVDSYVTSDSAVGTTLAGLIRGAQMVDHNTQWLNDSPLTIVEMRVCLGTYGSGCSNEASLIATLDLARFKENRKASGRSYGMSPQQNGASKAASGLILSLGGLPYQRVLLPVVVSSIEGRMETVYSADDVASDVLRTRGMVRFADTMAEAKGIDRIGNQYLVVPVQTIDPDNRIVVSQAAARHIQQSAGKNSRCLRDGRVIISAE